MLVLVLVLLPLPLPLLKELLLCWTGVLWRWRG